MEIHTLLNYTLERFLYYCDFNDPKYAKDYVHQIHCGTLHGKVLSTILSPSRIETSVFYSEGRLMVSDVERELKKRIENAKLSADAHS